MSAKSIREDPAQWARNHTYHWWWGVVRVRRRDQRTIDTWWWEYSRDEAKQKKLHEEVVHYRNKNFVLRFFIWLFNSENIGLKLKLYEFFMQHDPTMFVNGERKSDMSNDDGVLNAVSKHAWRWAESFWALFFKNNSCIQNDTEPKDSGRNIEENQHDDEVRSTTEVWSPHDNAMKQYLAVPPLHLTPSELQAAQEGLVIDTKTKLSALQEWKDFYRKHMGKNQAHTEKAEVQLLESSDAIGSTYHPKIISKQWRRVSLKVHPDKGGDTETFQRLNNIQEFLTQEPLKNAEGSPSALWHAICQFRKKLNRYAEQRFKNWHAATERYVMASWSDSEDSTDTREQLKQTYYAGCEAAFRHYRKQRKQVYRELMGQYVIQKSQHSQKHAIVKGYADIISNRAILEKEWRLADLELYREGCQRFCEPLINELKEEKQDWLEERERLQSCSEKLRKKKAELDEEGNQLQQRASWLKQEKADLQSYSSIWDEEQCDCKRTLILSQERLQALYLESHRRALKSHESNQLLYERDQERHQKKTESAPRQIFSFWKSIYTLKSFEFVGAHSPMSCAFWEREQTECYQAIIFLRKLKKAYPGGVTDHTVPKNQRVISPLLTLYQLHNQTQPASDSEVEEKTEESEAALNRATDKLGLMGLPAGANSAEILRTQADLSIYSVAQFTAHFMASCGSRAQKAKSTPEEESAGSRSEKADYQKSHIL